MQPSFKRYLRAFNVLSMFVCLLFLKENNPPLSLFVSPYRFKYPLIFCPYYFVLSFVPFYFPYWVCLSGFYVWLLCRALY